MSILGTRVLRTEDPRFLTSGGVYTVDGNSDQLTRLGRGQATRVGNSPAAIAVSGATAYVVNTIDGTVTPIDTATGCPGVPVLYTAHVTERSLERPKR